MEAKQAATWLAFVLAYLDAKWPHAAAKSRDGLTDSLATVTPSLVKDTPGRPDAETLWRALRHFLLSPGDREKERPAEIASAVRWLEQASLPLGGRWPTGGLRTLSAADHPLSWRGCGSSRGPFLHLR